METHKASFKAIVIFKRLFWVFVNTSRESTDRFLEDDSKDDSKENHHGVDAHVSCFEMYYCHCHCRCCYCCSPPHYCSTTAVPPRQCRHHDEDDDFDDDDYYKCCFLFFQMDCGTDGKKNRAIMSCTSSENSLDGNIRCHQASLLAFSEHTVVPSAAADSLVLLVSTKGHGVPT